MKAESALVMIAIPLWITFHKIANLTFSTHLTNLKCHNHAKEHFDPSPRTTKLGFFLTSLGNPTRSSQDHPKPRALQNAGSSQRTETSKIGLRAKTQVKPRERACKAWRCVTLTFIRLLTNTAQQLMLNTNIDYIDNLSFRSTVATLGSTVLYKSTNSICSRDTRPYRELGTQPRHQPSILCISHVIPSLWRASQNSLDEVLIPFDSVIRFIATKVLGLKNNCFVPLFFFLVLFSFAAKLQTPTASRWSFTTCLMILI